MPLFTMPKKSENKEFSPQTNNLIIEKPKPQNTTNFDMIREDYGYLGCSKTKFYYHMFLKDVPPIHYIQATYTNEDDKNVFILLEMFALKCLIDSMFLSPKKQILVYSNLTLDKIQEFSELKEPGSMYRYKAREVLNLMSKKEISVVFKQPTEEIQELINNENQLQ